MKELTPEEMKLISGGAKSGSGLLPTLFNQLGRTLDNLFGRGIRA